MFGISKDNERWIGCLLLVFVFILLCVSYSCRLNIVGRSWSKNHIANPRLNFSEGKRRFQRLFLHVAGSPYSSRILTECTIQVHRKRHFNDSFMFFATPA